MSMDTIQLMLVDDEKAFLNTLTKRLEKRNFVVTTAYSGTEALEVLKNNDKIETVILDVKMPGMDGIETLAKIKTMHPIVEVIMLTGHATVDSAIDGMKQGAFDYLMKPCEIDQLIAKVEEATHRKRSHEQKITEARIKEITDRRV